MNKKESVNTHKDHRKRLKTKVRKNGLDCLEYHEILELLLTYSIPRKDTNPIGHNLIEYFGGFSNVFDADYHDLLKVEGIGPESALFIRSLSELIEIYNKSKLEKKTYILNNTTKCIEFFRNFYSIKDTEFMIMACLTKNKKVLKTYRYKGRDDTEISFDLRQIMNDINNQGVHSIVLFHTHPCGDVEPSFADVQTTQKIINMVLSHGIDFEDHIILNESEHYSFGKHDLIKKMKTKYLDTVNVSELYREITKPNIKENDKIEIDEE